VHFRAGSLSANPLDSIKEDSVAGSYAPLWALAGYAIGTIQVLFIDWARARTSHRSHLRLIRAELRRLSAINKGFEWRDDGPGSDVIPKPPELTSTFFQAVAGADFHLTDEHDEDNTQQGLLELLDGCTVLQHYHRETLRRSAEAKQEQGGQRKLELWFEAKELADEYDATMDQFQTHVTSALNDINRRLRDSSWWRQLNRPIGKLPPGTNPSPLPDRLADRLKSERDAV
jgi:hypothetical protein